MKEYFINTLQLDEEFIDFFMVKSIGVKVGANKKNYLDVTLGDSTGEINGKKWDVSDEELKNLSAINEFIHRALLTEALRRASWLFGFRAYRKACRARRRAFFWFQRVRSHRPQNRSSLR